MSEYAIEMRNQYFLHPEYFAVLKRHNVAHVFNSWAEMAPVAKRKRRRLRKTAASVVSPSMKLHSARCVRRSSIRAI